MGVMFELIQESIDMKYPTKFGHNLLVTSLARASQTSTRGHNSARNGATALIFELVRELMDIYHPTKFGKNPTKYSC